MFNTREHRYTHQRTPGCSGQGQAAARAWRPPNAQTRQELVKMGEGEETIQQIENLGSEFRNRHKGGECVQSTCCCLPYEERASAWAAHLPPTQFWDRQLSHERHMKEPVERQKQGGHHKNEKTRSRSKGTGTLFPRLCFPGHPISSFKSCYTRGLFQNLQPSPRISGFTTCC